MILAQATEIAAEVAKQLQDASSVQEVLAVLVGVLVLAVLALFVLYVRSLKDYAAKVEELKDQVLDIVVDLNERLASSQEE